MKPEKVSILIEWARIEGWNPDMNNATFFALCQLQRHYFTQVINDQMQFKSKRPTHYTFAMLSNTFKQTK